VRFRYRRFRETNDPPGAPARVKLSIPARVIGLSSAACLFGLLDTGSELTLLDKSFIDVLDVHIRPGDYDECYGASGKRFDVCYGVVDVELANPRRTTVYRWSARVGFMQRPHGGGAIFGYEGFLEYFLVSFHGPKQHITLSPRKDFPPPCMPGDRVS